MDINKPPMSAIPDDVLDVACAVLAGAALHLGVAHAILAERERCAKIADEFAWDDRTAAAIAARIRDPEWESVV